MHKDTIFFQNFQIKSKKFTEQVEMIAYFAHYSALMQKKSLTFL